MQSEKLVLENLKDTIEFQIGWGDGHTWSNQDFIELSEQIFAKTRVNLSPSTLKRVWGRVRYSGKPSTTTLDTLAKFSGYENWRDFKLKAGYEANDAVTKTGKVVNVTQRNHLRKVYLTAVILTVAIILYSGWIYQREAINPGNYQFSSKTIITEGVPNSVVFNFEASASPYDSVIIQQSWNQTLQTKVPKNQRQHTSIYYLPNNFVAKLIVGDHVVKEHNLLIRSNGWLPVIEQKPVPVYLPLNEVKNAGKLAITASQVTSKSISVGPIPPIVMFTNVRDFGEIYSDNFIFEASVKNTYDGTGACQNSSIFLYCIGTVIKVPLCAKGCISDANILFTDYYSEGKNENLSSFGVDFKGFVKVRIESAGGKAKIFINNKLAYSVNDHITKAKIIGISCRFAVAGAVDFISLTNGKILFRDDF